MITVLFGGSRPEGNTAQLARFALEGHDYEWIDLTQYQLNPVRDMRHEEGSSGKLSRRLSKIIDKGC
jgi:multimeric flavodoxin WrbA